MKKISPPPFPTMSKGGYPAGFFRDSTLTWIFLKDNLMPCPGTVPGDSPSWVLFLSKETPQGGDGTTLEREKKLLAVKSHRQKSLQSRGQSLGAESNSQNKHRQ